jgi:hypothetical protein
MVSGVQAEMGTTILKQLEESSSASKNLYDDFSAIGPL